MDSFKIQLVSNASLKLFPDDNLSSFSNFHPEHVNLDGQSEVTISDISHLSMYQKLTEGKILDYDEMLSNARKVQNLETGLYTCIENSLEAMNLFNRINKIKTSPA